MIDAAVLLSAMDGEWKVERYEVDEPTGKLRVWYLSLNNPLVYWSHLPFGELTDAPPVGVTGRIGFLWDKRQEVCNDR